MIQLFPRTPARTENVFNLCKRINLKKENVSFDPFYAFRKKKNSVEQKNGVSMEMAPTHHHWNHEIVPDITFMDRCRLLQMHAKDVITKALDAGSTGIEVRTELITFGVEEMKVAIFFALEEYGLKGWINEEKCEDCIHFGIVYEEGESETLGLIHLSD